MRLYINVDHVATVREARKTDEPDPVAAALRCENAGAHGITAHLREDRRHMHDHDLERLAAVLTTPLNFELATSADIVALACRLRPFEATLVPERRAEVTTEGGLDLSSPPLALREAIKRLTDAGSKVSLFIDPDPRSIDAAVALGVPAIELHTGRYAHTWHQGEDAIDTLREAARYAKAGGLAVHAGHGLTYENVSPVAAIPEIEELNIGHSVIARSIFDGIEGAVRTMGALVAAARPH